MDPPNDDRSIERAWLRRIAEGDRSAFEALFRAYERRLYRYAARVLADDDAANDVVADVMIEVWRSAKRYEGRSQPSTWIFGIAHHKAHDALRRKHREVARLRLAQAPQQDDRDPLERVIAESARAEIDAALDRISPDHRAVLHLTFILGYSQADIAAIVGCPIGTVKTRVHHAKRALRTALANSESERRIS